MDSKFAYYKSCPLKKRPIIIDEEEEIEVVALTPTKPSYNYYYAAEEQPQDLSLKRKATDIIDYEPPTKCEYVLDLTMKVMEPKPKRFCSDSPISFFNTFESSSVLLSPPADLSNEVEYQSTNLHMRGLTDSTINYAINPYQSAFVSALGSNPIPVLWAPYHTNVEEMYPSPISCGISAISPHSILSYQQMTPPSSPASDSIPEPEDLSFRNDIPLPALYHVSSTNDTNKKYRFKCDKCNKMYSTSMGLSKHQQFHCPAAECNQEKKQHSCKECGKLYTTVGALKMHVRTHTLPCKCHICGKAFSRPWLLQGHVRTHTGEKPFQCSDCPRSFADRSNLRAHQQTHVDVKKYACKLCHKSFSRMSLLNKHTSSNCIITIA